MPDSEPTSGQHFHNRRYRLDRKIGQGGMGSVWLAVDEHLSEEVALKFLPPEIQHDPSSLDDMRRETSRSRRLAHPNIVRIHDMHEYPGEVPFISMEFIAGVSLSGLKSQQPKRCFPWDFLKTIIEQLCSALEYAHAEGVIHRDLKPGNVMLDERGRVKLADFGIAAVATDSMSRVSLQGNTSGTPAYMSPQQMDGRSPRITDDIYSLGAMIYELFTGKPPFFRGDIPHQVRTIDPPTIEERLDEFGLKNPIPPEVSAMIMACLSKDPTTRPQSARSISEWIGTTGDRPAPGTALADHVFERTPGADESNAPSSKELTVLPPDEPTDYSDQDADPMSAAEPRQPTPDSQPRLTDGTALLYDPSVPASAPGGSSRRSRKMIVGIVCAILLLVILGGLAKKKRNRAGPSRSHVETGVAAPSADSDSTLLVTGPWRSAKPTEISVGRMPGLFRPYELGSLDNCTVVVLEEVPGQPDVKRTIQPWRPQNEYWSIDEGIISVAITRDSPGATKTFLVFNGLDLRSFLLAFVYRAGATKYDQGNFGVFYRCRNLANWRFDGYGAVLGDNTGELWGLPDNAYTVEHRQFGESQPKMLKELMMQSRRSQLLQGGGHTCTIRADASSASHVIDQRVGHNYTFASSGEKPESGTIVIEAWLRGAGRLEASFEGMLIRTGRGFRP